MRQVALITALCLAAMSVGAAAAPAPAGKPGESSTPLFGASNEPIDITSDNSEQFRTERRAVWYGNVEVVQGTSRMRTPRLTVFYSARDPNAPKLPAGDPNADIGHIERVEADGPVYYMTPTQKAKGDHGTYVGADDTITLTGNVVLVQDKNVATGDKVVIEQKTGHSTLTSKSGNKQRVRAVLYPQNNSTAANGNAPAAAAPKGPGRP